MKPEQIIKNLESKGLSRTEIAHKLGVSPTTLNGWMSEKSARAVPKPVIKLLQKIWAELHGESDLRFTYGEVEIINKAIPISGCKNFPEFAHNTIMAKAKELVKEDDAKSNTLKAAEDKTPYNTKKK